MKKVVLFFAITLGLITVLWWIGGSEKKEQIDLSATLYSPENPSINIDTYRVIEAVLESATSTQSTEDTIKLFSKEDIKLTSDTEVSLKEYKKLIQEIVLSIESREPTEARVMLDVFNNKNSNDLSQIKESEEFFKGVNIKLLKITVPKNTIKTHLALLSHTEKISSRLAKMQLILSEPFIALENAQLYHIEISLLNQTLIQLNSYLNTIK